MATEGQPQRRRSTFLQAGQPTDKRLSALWYTNNNKEPREEEIESKLKILEEEISSIPKSKRTALLEATNCGVEMPKSEILAFLRSEEWDVKMTANRIARHWEERLRLFGPDKAYLPLTLAGALRDDQNVMANGFMQVTEATDDAGRGILFISPQQYIRGDFPVDAQVRVIWYMVYALLENEYVQRNGFIMMVDASQVTTRSIHILGLQKMATYSIGHCLPMRIGAFHFIQPAWPFRLVMLPFIKFFIGSPIAGRMKVSAGTDEEVISQLQEYGIQPDEIPVNIPGGTYELDIKKYMEERKAAGK